jgi:group I intron endonuclease
MRKTSGIYAITSPSGKQYIGQAQCLRTRWWEHRKYLRLGTHHCTGLQNAYNKYGETALVFSVIAAVPLEQLNDREQQEIDARSRDRLYNTALFVRRPRLGLRHSAESRARMALAAQNRSAEYRQKLAAGRKGKFHTPELKKAMSLAFSGENHPKWGTKHSPETMAKLIAAQQNRSPEWRAKISASKRGHPVSEETRAKLSASKIGKYAGSQSPCARPVRCIETGEIFDCLRYAEDWLKGTGRTKADSGAITKACKGKLKSAYGFRWEYVSR